MNNIVLVLYACPYLFLYSFTARASFQLNLRITDQTQNKQSISKY